MIDQHYDIAIIGAGMAGTSVAAQLARHCKVVLLEQEALPAYHTTGRSAAVFAPCYGPACIRALTRASEQFFHSPPAGFSVQPLISDRPILLIARDDQLSHLDKELESLRGASDAVRVEQNELTGLNQLLKRDYAVAGILDRQGLDIDVAALHQGYLQCVKQFGGTLITDAMVNAMDYQGGCWQLQLPDATVRANIVVNAAGAWADQIGAMAGAINIGLVPKRRTAVMVATPAGVDTTNMPITIDIEEQFYLKPEGAQLLLSPADETPSLPCDAQPEAMDVAVCIDRIGTAFDLDIQRPLRQWAGLRSFVSDGEPVVGFDVTIDGFFWLAGQGGYGIQTAPALAALSAALITRRAVPDEISRQGLNLELITPDRFPIKAVQ